jgi:hypothetical protein
MTRDPKLSGAHSEPATSGVVMAAWPTKIVKARVMVLGLDSTSTKQ